MVFFDSYFHQIILINIMMISKKTQLMSLLRKVQFVDFHSFFAPPYGRQRSAQDQRKTIENQQIKSPLLGIC
mgnify:FL=1